MFSPTKPVCEITGLPDDSNEEPSNEESYHAATADTYYSRVNMEEPFLVARVDSAANKFETNGSQLLRAQRPHSRPS